MFWVDVVSSTRADYGLLRPVVQKLKKSVLIRPRILACGAHLSAEHGSTISEIEADGFDIAARLDFLAKEVPKGRVGTALRCANALGMFIDYFAETENTPNAVVILGDRYEVFAAGQAAALLDIPVIHISGGDVTLGADDEWFRHCLTKMAKLHFPSCEEYRRRVIKMGEAPNTVFNVGGLGDENIRSMRLLSKKTLLASIGMPADMPYAVVTLHPETQSLISPRKQASILLEAVMQRPKLFYLFTGANADAGGEEINACIAEHCNTAKNAMQVASLGVLRYLSAAKYASLVLGNSSSGVVETPSLGVPTVDIGMRQAGRITGENVIHCAMRTSDILAAMDKAISDDFTAHARLTKSPYNGGDTSGKIVAKIEEFLQSGALTKLKEFYDATDYM